MAWYRCGGTPSEVLSLPTPSEASGVIAQFNTDLTENLLSAVAEFEASQDLHGQASPYPAGAGINKWDEETELGIYNSTTGEKETSTTQLRSKNFIPVTPNTTYFFQTATANDRVLFYDTNKDYLNDSVLVTVNTFTTPANCYWIAFHMGTSYGTTYRNNVSINYPATNTDYHPYENICPITGVSTVKFGRSGINLWDEEWEVGGYNSSGNKVENANIIRCKNHIPVPKGSTVYIYCGTSGVTFRINTYNSEGRILSTNAGRQPNRTYSFSDDVATITFNFDTVYGNTYKNDISINFPSTETSYHAYTGNLTITVNLGGTYYGGYIDVVTGKITLTHGFAEYDGSDDENWSSYAASTYFGFAISISDMKSGNNQDGKCNFLKVKANYSETGIRLGANNNTVYCLHISDTISGVSDVASWKTYLSNNPLQIVYPLATPIVVYASNTAEIPTIVGDNQVYADSGNIAVKFLETVGHKI